MAELSSVGFVGVNVKTRHLQQLQFTTYGPLELIEQRLCGQLIARVGRKPLIIGVPLA